MSDSPKDPLWTTVDRWADGLFVGKDPGFVESLEAGLAEARAAGLPPIQVSAMQGRFLEVLARGCHAHRILEIGTLGGYSGSWLAHGLPPGGKLVTLELDPRHAVVARHTFGRLGLDSKVDVRVGPAIESLRRLVEERAPPFDLVFIDADKPSYPEYLDWALRLTTVGSLIVADNIVRAGEVAADGSKDARVSGVRRYVERCASDPRVRSSVVQTVGEKGYDGFAIAVVAESLERPAQ